jgi:hypothetical protein
MRVTTRAFVLRGTVAPHVFMKEGDGTTTDINEARLFATEAQARQTIIDYGASTLEPAAVALTIATEASLL